MFLRSLFYERTVLRHLERVRQLPVEVQIDIAMRVNNFVELARSVNDERLEPFAQVAREEQQRAVELGAKSDMDPNGLHRQSPRHGAGRSWVATGNLNQHSAIEIVVAIETFTSKRASSAPGLGARS